jgi:mannose-6-phosphate isomerase-like protein (cupin superfamily)
MFRVDRANSGVGVMRISIVVLALGLVRLPAGQAWAQQGEQAVTPLNKTEYREAQTILAEFAADYAHDHMATDAHFGIKLADRFWTVSVRRKEVATPRGRLTDHGFGPHDVKLSDGVPATPTWYFEFADLNVLRLVALGKVNAGTAAMQNFDSDKVGVEIRDLDGFRSNSGDEADQYLALSHFFTKGKPEVTRFGRESSLETHGALATSLHTMKGFRVAFFSIGPQDRANGDPDLSSGQMPNQFIITSGKGTLLTDDGPMTLEKGMSVFVPQFVKHEMVNDGKEPLEGILVLYGDNSDFAFGTSYPAYLQDLNDFHRQYPFRKPPAAPSGDR